ncbi:hypothetical protein CTEN210_15569 [Chaetoceros tenuissimus]|uniref:Uncharacterized protein n=1 Tax=Chaetoceros tenuissimus TaxID=426638 RepID=A0AAD3D762_9STRA|nr:hypothetical protein CTEN210_15569 [Chaetoceros tenuissimus]
MMFKAAITLSLFLAVDGFSVQSRINSRRTLKKGSLASAVLDEVDITSEVQLKSMNKKHVIEIGETEKQESSEPNGWDFVDQVYLITCPNADPSSTRLNNALGILADAGLEDRVQVKEFETDDEDRIRGCYTSHISVLQDAMRDIQSSSLSASDTTEDWFGSLFSVFSKSNESKDTMKMENSRDEKSRTKCVLVLEDNIDTTGNLNENTLKSIADCISSYDSVDMVHLSYIPYVPNLQVSKTDNKNIVRLSTGQSSALGTTAYIITEKAINTLINIDARNGFRAPIPDVMAEEFPESRYSAFPTPFLRAPKTKSLVNPQLDDLREVLFQPAVVSQVQKVLALTGVSTNNLLFATSGLLLATGAMGIFGVLDFVQQMKETSSYDGNILLLLVNIISTTFSIGILVQGALLAPKPPEAASAEDQSEEST